MIGREFFDTPVDRRGTLSYKWDTTAEDVVPMWVADMDFRTAPCIINALMKRVEHGIFGYTAVPESYYKSTCRWFERRHGWTIRPGSIIYTSGVVPAISAIIKALTRPGDSVATFTPAYNCFFSSIRNNGCNLAPVELQCDEEGHYTIDFEELEQVVSRPEVKLFILCNPHNPSGRVWSREELLRVGDICRAAKVTVVSDEIHCELVYTPLKYTPYGSLGESYASESVVCVSPSKAFNIAGLQIASIVCGTDELRAKIDRAINDNEVCDVNPFGVVATMAAYDEGGEWLDALVEYLHGNYLYFRKYLCIHLPELVVTPLEGTYLAWVNVSATGMTGDEAEALLEREAKVRLNSGSMYGPGGENYLRFNLACPRSVLETVLPRISQILRATLSGS